MTTPSNDEAHVNFDTTTGSLMYVTDRPPVCMVRGDGAWLWDHRGREYLDFSQGWAVNCLGHSPRVLVEAIKDQAAQLLNPSPAYYNLPAAELAGMIAAHSGLDKVFFANSGAEANEGAIKLARKWGQLHKGGAYEIITLDNAFHGRTLATMSASGKPQWRNLYEPKVSGFPKAPLNDIAAVRRTVTEQTVAVMLEPIQGEAGVLPATDGFLRDLRQLATETGILLIVDEVQTGMGRTGRLFAHEWAGIAPDIMTLGKGLGGGVPLAALVAREEICCFAPGDQGGTFNGAPLVTAVGCAVMREVTRPGFLDQVRATGEYLGMRLEELSGEFDFGEVRGRGLLLGLDLRGDVAPAIVAAALANGLLINAPRPDTLRFTPALNVSREEIDEMARRLRAALCQARIVGNTTGAGS